MGDAQRLLTVAAGRGKDDVEKNASGDVDVDAEQPGHALGSVARQRLSSALGRPLAQVRAFSWPRRVALVVCVVLLFKALSRLPSIWSPSLVGNPHPIPHLIARAELEHARRSAAEPTTLEQAYSLYRARHGRPPPKGYDAWFFYARRHHACRIGGFDELYGSLKIWWGVDPREIRERTERLGADPKKSHALGRVRVREGQVVTWEEMGQQGIGRGAEEMDDAEPRTALEEMLGRLVSDGVRLPDGESFACLLACKTPSELDPVLPADSCVDGARSRLFRQSARRAAHSARLRREDGPRIASSTKKALAHFPFLGCLCGVLRYDAEPRFDG